MKIKRHIPAAAAALLSAALLTASFPPFGETASIAAAIAPLLVVARLASPRKSAWTWFAGGFAFWFATLSWMPAICKNDGPWPLVAIGWLGLAALCAGYFALFGWLSARAWRRFGRWGLAFEPVLWAGIEWLRGWMFTGFAWNFLGTALVPVPDFLAPARVGGVYLVSALVVLVNGVFATLACRVVAQMRREAPRSGNRWVRSLETAVPLAVVFLVSWLSRGGLGEAGGARSSSAPHDASLRVALVQRNAPCVFRAGRERQDPVEAFSRLMTVAATARPDLVVWGESAMSEFGGLAGEPAAKAARHFSRLAGGAALLAGGDYAERTNGAVRVYNGAGLYVPSGEGVHLQLYAKQHLVPFGEYIPFDKWIPALQKLSPIGVSLHPGEAKVLEVPVGGRDLSEGRASVKIAPLICFEDTLPSLARRGAELGAQAIVLITNDSWFSDSFEAEQHAWQAVLRAVETGLPVIRVGNSGVTGVIDESGRTRWLMDGAGRPLVDVPGCQLETVQVRSAPRPTPYTRFGDWLLLVLFAASLAGLFMVKYRHENER
ncbi:MAG: apolipoprotein N-acyltransferase [Kiritimatiellae bacterium]|nr:apolipoprotein N-acyltransferase [Kiritimatiellia bacterium]